MSTAVYTLCALTSIACAGLLTRAYLRSPTRLLLWSSLCFSLLAVNNLLLVADLAIWTSADLSEARAATNLAGVAVLLGGLIWDGR